MFVKRHTCHIMTFMFFNIAAQFNLYPTILRNLFSSLLVLYIFNIIISKFMLLCVSYPYCASTLSVLAMICVYNFYILYLVNILTKS